MDRNRKAKTDETADLRERLAQADEKMRDLRRELSTLRTERAQIEKEAQTLMSKLRETMQPSLMWGGLMEAVCERLINEIEASGMQIAGGTKAILEQAKLLIATQPVAAPLGFFKVAAPQLSDFEKVRIAVKAFDDSEIAAMLAAKVREAAEIIESAYRTSRARENAQKKLALDPKQAAKAGARELWSERRAGKHPKLRTNEQFAAECIRRWPALTSAKVILGWCSTWNKKAKQQETQPAS